MTEFRFLMPIDVLYLRGNRLFGGAGDHSEALMPPWPSIAAGALRTKILMDHNVNLKEYVRGQQRPAGILGEVLGTPTDPGLFRVSCFMLGKKVENRVSIYFPPPADLVVEGESETCHYLHPTLVHEALKCSYQLKAVPVLRVETPSKPKTGLWLNEDGFRTYLNGEKLTRNHLTETDNLWLRDNRLGIAMDSARRSAEQGRIYTSEIVAMKEGVGFIIGVDEANGLLPTSDLLRFGGDGRGAIIDACNITLPEPPWEKIQRSGQFRLVLATPGLFGSGWLPPGTTEGPDAYQWSYQGMTARLTATSIGRAEVVSGWGLATDRPKTALKAVPAGSVYWFDEFTGQVDGLRRLIKNGLWDDQVPDIYRHRKAEGFNNVLVAAWRQER